MSPRDQAKHYQALLLAAARNPLVPAAYRAEIGALVQLLGEWGEIVQSVKGLPHGGTDRAHHVP